MIMQTKEKEDKPRHIRSGGEVTLYSAKAPYPKSGVSAKGGLELDLEDDTVRCHECGKWMCALGSHLRLHNLNAREYKLKHGLHSSSALVNERLRISLIERGYRIFNSNKKIQDYFIKNSKGIFGKRKPSKFFVGVGKAEGKNTNMICVPQILSDINKLAFKLGRTPSANELSKIVNIKTVQNTFGSYNKAIQLAGLLPNRNFAGGSTIKYDFNKKALLSILKNFYSLHKRAPSCSDAKRGLIPPIHVFKRLCGSWRSALAMAKITLPGYFYRRTA